MKAGTTGFHRKHPSTCMLSRWKWGKVGGYLQVQSLPAPGRFGHGEGGIFGAYPTPLPPPDRSQSAAQLGTKRASPLTQMPHSISSKGTRCTASLRLARVLRSEQEHRRSPAVVLGGWGRSGRRSGPRRPLTSPGAIWRSELAALPNTRTLQAVRLCSGRLGAPCCRFTAKTQPRWPD